MVLETILSILAAFIIGIYLQSEEFQRQALIRKETQEEETQQKITLVAKSLLIEILTHKTWLPERANVERYVVEKNTQVFYDSTFYDGLVSSGLIFVLPHGIQNHLWYYYRECRATQSNYTFSITQENWSFLGSNVEIINKLLNVIDEVIAELESLLPASPE